MPRCLRCVAAPLHAFALPRTRADPTAPADGPAPVPSVVLPPKGWPFVLVAAAFAAYAFVPSGMSAHLLAIFGRAGIDAATVVAIGALFGPAQVAARICELVFARRIHPLNVARFAVGMLLAGVRPAGAVRAHGREPPRASRSCSEWRMVCSPSRAAPCRSRCSAPAGYGHLMGRIGGPYLAMQAIAPLVLAFVAERASDPAVLAVVAAFATVAFVAFAAIRPPRATR